MVAIRSQIPGTVRMWTDVYIYNCGKQTRALSGQGDATCSCPPGATGRMQACIRPARFLLASANASGHARTPGQGEAKASASKETLIRAWFSSAACTCMHTSAISISNMQRKKTCSICTFYHFDLAQEKMVELVSEKE